MINCEPGSEQQVIDQLKSIEEIEEIQGVVGTYDIVAKIRTPSIEMLREIIILKIRKIQQIRATTTVMCLKETPNSHDLR
jgi:DNA-binding Lrp family transcriptional regulator